TVGLPGAQFWTVSGAFSTRVGEDRAKPWRGFFVSLFGPVHRFPVVAIENKRQTAAANPTVRAGAGNANTCPLQGLPANTTVLVTGDLMTVFLPSGHRRLVCLTQDLVSNGQGQGTAVFGPELGEVPAPGAQVEIQRPYAVVALTSEPPGWDVEPGQTYQFALTAEERK
ncbi:hypothetical protein ACQVP2_35835, partial [Methylobacterium aquaticum]|uniref:hypothetical protein n=1 Tax=Methylobacterium aquaticum TaxID=270351 RepID=UPI003D16FE17